VNVAPVTLLEPDFAQWLGAKLQRRGLPWGTLQLEMTEHAIIACGAHMVQAINDLRMLGVGVFMDDFGAGYSSLGVLADLPISGIKCDRLFVRQLPQDPRRQSLLRHVVRPPPAVHAALLLLLGRIRREMLPAFAPPGVLRACSCVVCCVLFALDRTLEATLYVHKRNPAK